MRDSLFFRAVANALLPLVLVFSVFMILRGHNAPGGGFIAGLLAALALALLALAFGKGFAQRFYRLKPFTLVRVGLLIAVLSGVIAMLALPGASFFQGYWVGGLGTPVIFDLGVFLVVFGIGVNFVFSLMEE